MTSWWVAWKDLLLVVRDKQALLTLIAMPLLLIAILGAAFGDMMDGDEDVTIKKFTLGIVNLDQGQLGEVLSEEVFRKELADQIDVEFYQEDKMYEKIRAHKLDVGIVIDEDFTASLMTGEQASTKLITVPDPGIKATIVSSVIEQFAQTIPIEAMAANVALPVQGDVLLDEPSQDLLNITSIDADTNPVSSFQYYAAAMGVMFLLMTVVQGVSTMILEKEQEVYKRLLISNLTYINYLTGKMIGLIVISLTQAFVIIIGTRLLFGVNWGNSVSGVVMMTFAFVVSACGLGVLAGSFIKTEKAFNAAGMLGTQIFAALGGSMAPLYIFPDWFVSVSKILPNGLALQTYLDLMSGAAFFEIIPAVLSSIGLGILFLRLAYFAFQSKGGESMRKIWAITWLHLKELFKSPGALVMMFILPGLFSWIFGGIAIESEQTKPIVDVVLNEEEHSTEIFNLLKKNEHYKWNIVTAQQAKEHIEEQDTVAAVIIPSNIQQRIINKQSLFDVLLRSRTEDYLALEPHLQGTANLIIRVSKTVAATDSSTLPDLQEAVASSKGVTIEKQTIQKDNNNAVEINLMFVGFAIMFMMFGLSGAASTILDERMGGTWSRLMIAPAHRLQISLGYLLTYFLMGWIQFAVLMSAMNIMFETNWGNLAYLIPFASLVILCVVGFGLMIAGIVKTKQQAGAIGAVLIVSTCMLGGVYWSIDLVPEFMQKISLAVPQSWAMSGFKEIISGSFHTSTLIKDTLALLGFTAGFFLIAIRGITYK